MKSYNFKVVIEPDDDRWHAYCPALKKQGASTWGNTQQEAMKHIQEVIQMIVEELIEDGEKIPVLSLPKLLKPLLKTKPAGMKKTSKG